VVAGCAADAPCTSSSIYKYSSAHSFVRKFSKERQGCRHAFFFLGANEQRAAT
jgi:hypothetical protein